ncbi:hypothetical protein CCUG63695_02338 [Mycobacteroides franklinii]|uniref:Cytoplasmic protein n=2 Tax=Mycobacteroides franklinii TaxID=948102 RepID=A0A4R8R8L2_9MYCO|nr:hypothetical protein CCUG64054_02411 [Mycobacteroides franklinii]TDZ52514.1 hypothetical protein CCUG63697_00996 [Mycobacteroides franklinii]TDZ55921.1 hypothetical protein CCUG63696_02413 [Mycobacteroides franklinii]TDZ62862.1 hypothetical protein CCUG63695_02338 [Mycobacteroides franklinii]TDZ69259.1 hypothetical protein CCUG64056_02411 [Mycobacteroides franklinii]
MRSGCPGWPGEGWWPGVCLSVCNDRPMWGRKSVEKAHAHCRNNRVALSRSDVCGCFYCLAIYSPSAITEWTDYDDSALCPKCGIDSVLAEDSGYPITEVFLTRMYARWFAIVHRVDGGQS